MALNADVIARPHECALVLSIPLSKASFDTGLDDPRKDLARHVARGLTGVRRIYEVGYERDLMQVLRVAQQVEAHGVRVLREIPLKALGALFTGDAVPKVVTLVAHWRFAPIVPDDIVDVRAIWRKISSGKGELCRRGFEALGPQRPMLFACIESGDVTTAIEILAMGLNRILEDHKDVTDSDVYWINRGVMEEEFGTALRAGACVEFADGLHEIATIAEQIPEGYPGVLDLSVCNSVILGEALRRRGRGIAAIVSRRAVALSDHLLFYGAVIEALKCSEGRGYLEIFNEIRERVVLG